ncbi:MAG: hypothetical protein JXD19_01730 [Deltaproteobacteria bacterium]|nr:hypothetical protein [Deltaproteobacteria bacterium]
MLFYHDETCLQQGLTGELFYNRAASAAMRRRWAPDHGNHHMFFLGYREGKGVIPIISWTVCASLV